MNKFRIGLIGLGGMAQAHIHWMKDEGRFEIIAVSDVNTEAMTKVGGSATVYTQIYIERNLLM